MNGKNNGSNRSDQKCWLSGGNTIADFVGIDRREIQGLVDKESFPAFKYRGKWRAIPEDLEDWSRKTAKRLRRGPPGSGNRRRGFAETR